MFWGNLVFDQVDLGVIPICVGVLARISNPHYLDIMSLFDVARRTISEMVNEESPRRIFEILNVHEEEETSDEKRT
jgi:hypothetical protein